MKIFKIALVSLLIVTSFAACKKNNDAVVTAGQENATPGNTNALNGIWVGEYVTTTRSAPVFLSFQLNQDSTLILLDENRGVIGSGNWEMVNAVFRAVYTVNSTQHSSAIEGTFLNSPEQLSGRWQYDQDYEDSGFWNVVKAQ